MIQAAVDVANSYSDDLILVRKKYSLVGGDTVAETSTSSLSATKLSLVGLELGPS